MHNQIAILIGIAICLSSSVSAVAQVDKRGAKAASSKKKSKSDDSQRAKGRDAANDRQAKKNNMRSSARRPITGADVKKVNVFVAKHLPELKSLLDVLEAAEPRRYSVAIRELFTAMDRLQRLEQRDPESYTLALKSWQLDKRAQLVAARFRMDGASTDEEKLRNLLTQRFELELQIMKRSRDRQAARLEKLESDIEHFRANRERAVESQVKNWMRGPSAKSKALAKSRSKKKQTTKTSTPARDAKKK